MMWSRILAAAIVVAAALWIGSGVLGRTENPAEAASEQEGAPAAQPFKVAVTEVAVQKHARTVVLSGRTEAADRASAVARTAGTILDLRVKRGDRVAEGDVLAVLSDEAREAQVAQAEALVAQRQADLDAKSALIKKGIVAANERRQLEADLLAAEAALATAQAEQARAEVRAPIAGVVSDVPVTVGWVMQPGGTVASVVALDPMLAVVEVAERQLGALKTGDRARVQLVTGAEAEGGIRFISPTASEGTRTYRVEIEIDNTGGTIPDGVTAEVALTLGAEDAVRLPRSVLTFTTQGELAVRTVAADGTVRSVPVRIVEDSRDELWVAGLAAGDRVIVQGQDFVKDGQHVEAVAAAEAASPPARS